MGNNVIDNWIKNIEFMIFLKKLRGILTWPNEDDQMNLTQICEHDRKNDNGKP